MPGKKLIAGLITLVMLTALPLAVAGQGGDSSHGDVPITTPEPMPEPMTPHDWWWEPSGFNYTDGFANGTFVDFNVNEDTGTVSDYTVTVQTFDFTYPMLIYGELYFLGENGEVYMEEIFPEHDATFQTVKVFESIEVDGFVPNGHPAVFGESFIYLGEDVMMNFNDFEWSGASYRSGEGNQTIVLEVADGFEVWKYDEYFDENYDDWADWEDDYETEMDEWYVEEHDDELPPPDHDGGDVGDHIIEPEPEPIRWDWDEVWIKHGGIVTSVWIDNGQATIHNNTVTIELYDNGGMEFSTWFEMPYHDYMEPWNEDGEYDVERMFIEGLIENGSMAATGYLFNGEDGTEWSDVNIYNDPTFRMEFMDIEDEWFEVEVESRVPEGRIVSINLNKGAINATDINDILVLLDDGEIQAYGSLEELAELEGGTDEEAGYYISLGDVQNTIYVYVPHFSVHTIKVQSVLGAVSNILVPGILAGVFIALAVIMVVRKGKKDKNEY